MKKKSKLLSVLSAMTLSLASCTNPFSYSPSSSTSSSASSSSSVESSSISSIEPSSDTSESSSTQSGDSVNLILKTKGKGDVTGGENGSYRIGTSITLIATPAEDYFFVGYYDPNDILLSDDNAYTFTIVQDTTINVVFDTNIESYYHIFTLSEFKDAAKDKATGETANIGSVNGIDWSFTVPTYLGKQTAGIQIGSGNNPQTSDWLLETTFSTQIEIVSYEVVLANATSGSAAFEVSFGDYLNSGAFASTSYTYVGEGNLDYKTTSFSLTLKSQAKAMYLYSISIDAIVPDGSDIDFVADGEEARDPLVAGEGEIPALKYNLISKDDYYDGIDLTESGDTLTEALHSLISNVDQTSYGDARYMLQYTDEDPSNPGYIYSAWTGDDMNPEWDDGGTWNREHTWPYSFLGESSRPVNTDKNIATDLHNLRAADSASNGFHSNRYYGNEDNSDTFYPNIAKGTLAGNHKYEGDFRGDTARIAFYMYVRYYPTLSLLNSTVPPSGTGTALGDLSVLLQWNTEDSVDEFEVQRNNRIFEYQGNRNPFVDYPDLADQIWE